MRQRGYSLVEVLVALLILTIVITTSLGVFLERNRRLQQANEIVLAYQALANEAEYQRRVPYKSLAPSNAFQSVEDVNILAPLAPYVTDIAVRETQPGVKNVLMTVRWKDGVRTAQLELVRVDTGGDTHLW